jgi:hypothetical protein
MEHAGAKPHNGAAEVERLEPDLQGALWPTPSGPLFHGITGEVAQLATRTSEADPVAVATSFLTWSGAVFGRNRYLNIGDEEHHGRLFVGIVGESAVARKGTSLAGTEKFWRKAEWYLKGRDGGPRGPQDFPLGCSLAIGRNLSTFEGLVYKIRDGEEPGDSNDPENLDRGVPDKRLLVIETELASLLRVSKRDGNLLSTGIRQAWDGLTLAPMTKTSRISVTNPHVCLIGHITLTELNHELGAVDVYNGLANRIMWMLARRSKIEPYPRPIPEADVDRIGRELAGLATLALQRARAGPLEFDNNAHELWAHFYRELTQERRGILDPLLSRGAPYVRRLSLIYALLDGANEIRHDHLEAAMATWRYSADSARVIFGERDADPNAQRLLDFLADGRPKSKEAIRTDCFRRNVLAPDIDRILLRLLNSNRITAMMEKRPRGRPATLYQIYQRSGS